MTICHALLVGTVLVHVHPAFILVTAGAVYYDQECDHMKSTPANDHLRLMDDRVQKQKAEIERLESLGQDTTEAATRLHLLQRAMAEMRQQLTSLTSTAYDARRPIASLRKPPDKK